MIINIRGTNGSGKSWLVYKLIHHMGGLKPIKSVRQAKRSKQPIVGRCRKVIHGEKVYVVGVYTADHGGGCDVISKQPQIYKMVGKYSKRGHVVFEGLLMSGMCGSLTRLSSEIDAQVVWAVLDTPFEQCYKATLLRRHTKGNFKFLDVHRNMIRKHQSIVSSAKHALDDGETVVILDHTQAFSQILNMLRDGKVKKPKDSGIKSGLQVLKDTVLDDHTAIDKCKTCLDFFPSSWYEDKASKDE